MLAAPLKKSRIALTLYAVPNGNLETDKIPKKDFPVL